MSRIRTIKPEFWEDETIGSLAFGARLMFIASWNMADDEGLLRWTPEYLMAKVFLYDVEVTPIQVHEWMEELEKVELLFGYLGGKAHERLAYILNFRKHQRIDKPQPGRFAPPSLQSTEVRWMYARRDGFVCHLCGGPVNESLSAGLNPDFDPSMDHVKPRSLGGSDYPSNIKCAHISCNKSRGNKPISEGIPGTFVEDSKGEQGTGKGTGTGKGSLFEQFWSEYPRKIGKANAEKAWLKAVKDNSATDIVHAAAQFRRHCQRVSKDVKFTPHPATWLNGGRWADELDAEEQQASGKPTWMSNEAWDSWQEEHRGPSGS